MEDRDKTLSTFRNTKGGAVLFCYGDAGVGLNLQFCRTIVNFDIPWNPMKLEQRIGRIQRYGSSEELKRQGFSNEIFILNLIHENTIEETIHKSCLAVLELVTDVIGKLEVILGHVGDEYEIRALIGNAFLARDVSVEIESESEETEFQEKLVSAEAHLRSKIEKAINITEESLEDEVLDFAVDPDISEF